MRNINEMDDITTHLSNENRLTGKGQMLNDTVGRLLDMPEMSINQRLYEFLMSPDEYGSDEAESSREHEEVTAHHIRSMRDYMYRRRQSQPMTPVEQIRVASRLEFV